MLRNFRCVFCRFKWEDYNKLREMHFINVRGVINMLHAIYLWNMFYAICYVGVHPAFMGLGSQLGSLVSTHL